MNKIPTSHTTMRQLILPLILAGAVSGMADAASGVRIHRIGDAPLPPRSLDTRSAKSYRKTPTPPNRLAKPIPAKPSSQLTAPEAAPRGQRLPLAPEGVVHTPAASQPAAPQVSARPVSRYAPSAQPVVVTPQPAPAPVAAPAPAPAPVAQPVVQPAPAPAAAPAAPAAPKPRRRLPIAPVTVADGSTDLPPVPAALLRS